MSLRISGGRLLARGLSVTTLGGLILVAACSAPGKGALIMAISTDMQAPKDISTVSIFITEGVNVKFDYVGLVFPDGSVTLPSTLALVEPDDPSTQIQIRVIGFNGQTAQVLRDIQTTVPHERTALLRVPLDFIDLGSGSGTITSQFFPSSADGVAEGLSQFDPDTIASKCDPMQLCQMPGATCMTTVNGSCTTAVVPSAQLPDYDDNLVFGANGTSTSNEKCFNVASCFASAVAIPPAEITFNGTGACTFPLPTATGVASAPDGGAEADSSAPTEDASATDAAIAGGSSSGGSSFTSPATDSGGESMAGTNDASAGPRDGAVVQAAEIAVDAGASSDTPSDAATSAGSTANSGGTSGSGSTTSAASTLNFAMVTTSIGACNGQGECFVPIENDPAEGWSLSGNTVTLAAGLCGQLAGAPAAKGAASGTAQLFFANDANNPSCATKTEAQPVCGEAQLLGDGGGEDASSPGDGGAIAMGTGAPDANTSGGAFDSGKGSSGGGPNGPADAGQSAPVDASVVASGVLSGVTSLAAGPSTTCAVIQNNDVDCWGLVLGTETATPEPIAGLAGVSTGALGGSPTNGFACALQGAGGGPVSCEGANGTGQLGDESIMDSDSPMAVSGLTTATAIAAGTGFACAIVKSGDVECWGDDTYGQLGNETMGQTFTSPVAVQGLPMATAIALGSDFACALVQGGFVECWGDNANEIFGSSEAGAPASSSTPVTVEGFQVGDTISTIAAGLSHVCALMESGAVYCWGDNSFEQLGQSNSSLSVSATPIAVVPAGVTAIAAGGNATCVIMQGGEVECWGSNLDGQLGNASVGQFSAAPVTPGVSGAKSLVVGGEHACALLTDGTVECWGSNAYGQIGTGSYNFAIETASPVTAAGTGLAAASDAATPAP